MTGLAVVSAFAAVLAGAPAAQGEERSRRCVVGPAGVGDSYFPAYGNGGYDVRHYDLDVRYQPANDRLAGEARVNARARKNLCSVNLDLVGLQVRSVTVDGRRAQWSRSGQELTVTPRRPLQKGARFTVEIRYDGVPVGFTLPGTDLRAGFMATPDGANVVGAPEVAAAWSPVNDHPIDKASYSFDVTVPNGYEVVANGFLRDRDRHRGWTTWSWEAREPMASYLATIDIGAWDVHRWRTTSGIPVLDAVDSALTGELRTVIDGSLARQGEILDLLSGAFGRYPFSTTGAIVDNQDDLYFALETQTRPVYPKYFWLDGEGNPVPNDYVVVHELAHQWFGDDVALTRWQDVWLNEGFASYAEWLWAEHESGITPREILEFLYEAIPADDLFWTLVIGNPGTDQLFYNPVYLRGAMTVQALRNEVGDATFWRIIRRYVAANSGGNATTEEFVAIAERVSGRQLDDLFTAWLFTGAKPPPDAVTGAVGGRSRLSAEAHDAAAAVLDRRSPHGGVSRP